MARLAWVVVPGIPYHLTHWGNHRANVFFNDEDRRAWLDELAGAAGRFASVKEQVRPTTANQKKMGGPSAGWNIPSITNGYQAKQFW